LVGAPPPGLNHRRPSLPETVRIAVLAGFLWKRACWRLPPPYSDSKGIAAKAAPTRTTPSAVGCARPQGRLQCRLGSPWSSAESARLLPGKCLPLGSLPPTEYPGPNGWEVAEKTRLLTRDYRFPPGRRPAPWPIPRRPRLGRDGALRYAQRYLSTIAKYSHGVETTLSGRKPAVELTGTCFQRVAATPCEYFRDDQYIERKGLLSHRLGEALLCACITDVAFCVRRVRPISACSRPAEQS